MRRKEGRRPEESWADPRGRVSVGQRQVLSRAWSQVQRRCSGVTKPKQGKDRCVMITVGAAVAADGRWECGSWDGEELLGGCWQRPVRDRGYRGLQGRRGGFGGGLDQSGPTGLALGRSLAVRAVRAFCDNVVIGRRVCFRYVASRHRSGLLWLEVLALVVSRRFPFQKQRECWCAVSVRSGTRRTVMAVVAAAAAATAVAKGSGRTFDVARWEETTRRLRGVLPNCKLQRRKAFASLDAVKALIPSGVSDNGLMNR